MLTISAKLLFVLIIFVLFAYALIFSSQHGRRIWNSPLSAACNFTNSKQTNSTIFLGNRSSLSDVPRGNANAAGTQNCVLKVEDLPRSIATKSSFQRVMDLSEYFYVYSAYFHHYNESNYIRIIGIGHTQSIKLLLCNFIDKSKLTYHRVIGRTYQTIDDTAHKVHYRSCFTLCKIPPKISPPKYVSVTSTHYFSRNSCKYSNLLKVRYPPSQRLKSSPRDNISSTSIYPIEFAACIKPAHDYNDTFAIIEWIEYNKLMGVKHFTLYAYSMAESTKCTIRRAYHGEIDVIDWNPPIRDSYLLLRNGMLAALNDCLYRYKGISKYTMFKDLDEFIVPNGNLDFAHMLASVREYNGIKNETEVGYYKFTNGFFFKCWDDILPEFISAVYEPDESLRGIMKKMILARKNRLTQPFYDPLHPSFENRSKFIAHTDNAIEFGVHLVYELRPGSHRVFVDEIFGYMHHYRVFFQESDCMDNKTTVEENSAHKFVRNVAANILKKMINVKQACGEDALYNN